MGVDPKRRTPQVREARPEWPRRKEPADQPSERESRAPEIWETPHGVESYPGSTVLEDWAVTEEDEVGTVRVLARYAVMRVLLLRDAGVLAGNKLRTERRIATEHLGLLPTQDWERMALQRLNDLCKDPFPTQVLNAINVAAEAAAKRGHVMGAFSLYRAAYAMALERAVWDDAERGARGIARLARMDEAQYSARLWERRANVLEKRVARARAAAAAAATSE